jgi:hypothetical protein
MNALDTYNLHRMNWLSLDEIELYYHNHPSEFARFFAFYLRNELVGLLTSNLNAYFLEKYTLLLCSL